MAKIVVSKGHSARRRAWARGAGGVDALARLGGRAGRRVLSGPRDRGDVPGWVLVTIMTAGLVVTLWAVAGDRLSELFSDAVDSVHAK